MSLVTGAGVNGSLPDFLCMGDSGRDAPKVVEVPSEALMTRPAPASAHEHFE